MKDKISQLIDRRKALEAEIDRVSALNTKTAADLVARLKRRWAVLDKIISDLWE